MSSPVSDGTEVQGRGRSSTAACTTLGAANCQCARWLATGQQVICEDEIPPEGPTAVPVIGDGEPGECSKVYDAGAGNADESPMTTPTVQRSTDSSHSPRRTGRHIDENIAPIENTPVVQRVTESTIQLRRWIVLGLGVLIGMTILLYALLELVHPERDESARNFLQTALTVLVSSGGPIVAFLFARENDR